MATNSQFPQFIEDMMFRLDLPSNYSAVSQQGVPGQVQQLITVPAFGYNPAEVSQQSLQLEITSPSCHKETTLLEDISNQLTCSICLQQYTNPKMVTPCSHTFCQGCLEKTIETTARLQGNEYMFNCPQCRGVVKFDNPLPRRSQSSKKRVAEEVVKKLYKPNFEVQSLIDIINKKTESNCSNHTGESLTFFCKTCEQCICQVCLINDHMIQKHDVTPVKHEAQAIRAGFDKDVVTIENRMKVFKKSLQECPKDTSQMTSDADKLIHILDIARTNICQFKKNIRQQESKCKESKAKAESYQKDCATLKEIASEKDIKLLQKRKEGHQLSAKLKNEPMDVVELPRNQLSEIYQDVSRQLQQFATKHNLDGITVDNCDRIPDTVLGWNHSRRLHQGPPQEPIPIEEQEQEEVEVSQLLSLWRSSFDSCSD
ncbi:tripartite motif-containing protein 55-like [Amphiura filiformis]|uniref:tripartite motif-containing protein 55-like n=1 Tax=Amphiura filiformis TaxID=82378 RepID=UPI003B2194B7